MVAVPRRKSDGKDSRLSRDATPLLLAALKLPTVSPLKSHLFSSPLEVSVFFYWEESKVNNINKFVMQA